MEEVTILGIDLGTTNSLIAVWDINKQYPRILNNQEGEHLTPSVVVFDPETGQTIVGKTALDKLTSNPGLGFYSVKRFIGRTFLDEWVKYDQRHVTYSIDEASQKKVILKTANKVITPSQVSAEVLIKLKNDAENSLGGQKVNDVVITVPAYFNEAQRDATREAGKLAGLNVRWIINEPTAAALAFGLGGDPMTVAVYDLGGGTFDISVLRIEGGLFRVKAISGDTHLGGDDFDSAIINWLQVLFKEKYDINLPIEKNSILRSRLRLEAERVKIELSKSPEYETSIKNLWQVNGESLELSFKITRNILAELVDGLIQKSLTLFDEALERAKIKPAQLDQILLVGGQTRSQVVKAAIESKFPGCQINDSVNPDEAVAQGAAILGARLCGHLKDQIRLWDVIPLSLGIELPNGKMDVIVRSNEQIPVVVWRRGKDAYTTQRDGQERILFKIYQGERPIANQNTFIGELILQLVTSRPKGEPRIHCMFKVDQDGILHIQAEDAEIDAPPIQATFDHVYRMSDEEISAKIRDAEMNRESDSLKLRLQEIEDELERFRMDFAKINLEESLVLKIQDLEMAIHQKNITKAEEILRSVKTNFQT
jgi:molecular chaperone DnaK